MRTSVRKNPFALLAKVEMKDTRTLRRCLGIVLLFGLMSCTHLWFVYPITGNEQNQRTGDSMILRKSSNSSNIIQIHHPRHSGTILNNDKKNDNDILDVSVIQKDSLVSDLLSSLNLINSDTSDTTSISMVTNNDNNNDDDDDDDGRVGKEKVSSNPPNQADLTTSLILSKRQPELDEDFLNARKICILLYCESDSPRVFVSVHHKTGVMLSSDVMRIIKGFCPCWRPQDYFIRPSLLSPMQQLQNADLNKDERSIQRMTDLWGSILNRMDQDSSENSGYRMIHFLRSPIATIVSGYLYHRRERGEEAANDLIQDAQYRRIRLVPSSMMNRKYMDDWELDLGFEFDHRWRDLFELNQIGIDDNNNITDHNNNNNKNNNNNDEFDPSSLSEQINSKIQVWSKLKYIMKPQMKWLPNSSQLQCLILPSSFVSSFIHSSNQNNNDTNSNNNNNNNDGSLPNLYNPYLSQLIFKDTSLGDRLRQLSERIINLKNRVSLRDLYSKWTFKQGLLLEFLRFFNCEFSSQLTSLITRCHLHSLLGTLFSHHHHRSNHHHNHNHHLKNNVKNQNLFRNSICDAQNIENTVMRVDMDQTDFFNTSMNQILDFFNLHDQSDANVMKIQKHFHLYTNNNNNDSKNDGNEEAKQLIKQARELILNRLSKFADIHTNSAMIMIKNQKKEHINEDEQLENQLRKSLVKDYGSELCQFLKKVTLIMEFQWEYKDVC